MYLPSGLKTTPSGRPPTSISLTFVTFLPSIRSTATFPFLLANHAFFGTPALPLRRMATAISPVGLMAKPSGASPTTTVDDARRDGLEVDDAYRVDVTVGAPGVAVVGADAELAVRGDVDVIGPEAHGHILLVI